MELVEAKILNEQITVYTKMAIGFRQSSYGKDGLTFKVGKRMQFINIKLENDLYNIHYFRIDRNFNIITIKKHDQIYVSMLNTILYDCVNK